MGKRGKSAFVFAIAVLFVVVLVSVYFVGKSRLEGNGAERSACVLDGDCAKDFCCHAFGCINKKFASKCDSAICTMECVPDSLDCGQASCKCVENKCTKVEGRQDSQIANPASVYCIEEGGELEIRTNDLGQYGVCKLANGSECEEWIYYRSNGTC